jgi:uncharacterized protein (DUF1501 family)
MVALRDYYIDSTYSAVKTSGTPAQRKFLDRYAQSRQEAIDLGGELGNLLSSVNTNGVVGQIKTAIALIKLNVSPVITLGLPFGGDNHNDTTLSDEVSETIQSVKDIATLWSELKAAGLQDRVNFASINVFGRTLRRVSTGGRTHHAQHHTTIAFGSNIKGGVVGGYTPIKSTGISELKAAAIKSTTGGTTGGTDIPYEHGLASVGKTLAYAAGVSTARINARIDPDVGKVISGGLV